MLDKAVNKKPLGNFFPEMCCNADLAFLKSVFWVEVVRCGWACQSGRNSEDAT
jgi:hypothetical protein